MGQHGAQRDDALDNEEDEEAVGYTQPERQNALDSTAASWVRRGYTIRYQDPFLVQVVRREALRWGALGWLMLALATTLVTVLLALGAVRSRRWHVVTLALRPDGRVIMHSQRAPRPPRL